MIYWVNILIWLIQFWVVFSEFIYLFNLILFIYSLLVYLCKFCRWIDTQRTKLTKIFQIYEAIKNEFSGARTISYVGFVMKHVNEYENKLEQ